MRILHVVPSYLPAWRYGGPIRSVHGLCKGLAQVGHEVHVLTTDVDGPYDLDVPLGQPVPIDGVRVWYYRSWPSRRLNWSRTLGQALAARIRHFDVVHAHSLFLWTTLAAARYARRHGVPYFISPRGMLVRDLVRRKSRLLKSAWITLFDRRNLERASALHMTSTLELRDAEQFGFRLPPMFVVPNGIDLDPAMSGGVDEPGRRADGPLLFLGRVNWKKGLDRLLPAMVHAPRARLVVAGNDETGHTAELRRLAVACGVSDRVSFAGQVMGKEKERLLKGASLLVLPSYNENFGNVVLEAMGAGCPVLVTPEVGAADVVRETGAGRVAPGDPRELGLAIAGMLADRGELAEMGRRGRAAAVESFSWESIGRRMEREYARFTSGGATPGAVPGVGGKHAAAIGSSG